MMNPKESINNNNNQKDNKTDKNSQSKSTDKNKKNKNKNKNNSNYKPSNQLKTIYQFVKGVPPSSNWSNHFTSLLFSNKKYLIYISNSFVIVIDLDKKNFSQILSSNKIMLKDKPNILIELNNEKFLIITNNGELIIFGFNNENYFIEDLSTNKLSKVIKKVKCGLYDKEQKLLILSNEESIFLYSFEYENELNIYKVYEIDNANNSEYFITDMLLINHKHNTENNKYLLVSNNIGNIILYNYDIIKYTQLFVINNGKKENIFNICYDQVNNLLASINKSGTLNIYKLNYSNAKITYEKTLSLSNKFNDQTINEFYLYFSISFINDFNLLVTSNQGRIFIYDIKNNNFKEIAENPHKNSIYTILLNIDSNQAIFFSSDYKISLFNIFFSNTSEPSLNFIYCINTIPSKVKILGQYSKKIYFMYQIQHNLYVNSYNIKKDKNFLETLQNKIKSFSNNDNNVNDYNLNLCKLIDEENVLLVNRKNEIVIYNIDENIKKNSYSFLNEDYLIIDIIINENILYILYKKGVFTKYNINNNKIEKYKISNSINKGSLIYIRNEFVIAIIKEDKTNIVKFLLIKNYFLAKLYEVNISHDFVSQKIILPNDNFYFFYSINDNFEIIYMNLNNQLEILNSVKFNDINYQEYLKIMDDFSKNVKMINKKKYIFKNLFQRNDVNKNNFKNTNIAFNQENDNMICSFSDGSVMYYSIDIDRKENNYYNINKIIYKYLIKANFLSINSSIFISNNDNKEENISPLFACTSSEQSLKIIDISNCNILNIYFKPKESNGEEETNINDNISDNQINLKNNNNFTINKCFTNLFSSIFFIQSYKEAKKFFENFVLIEDLYDCSIEQLIFSYFNNNKEKNFYTIKKIVEFAIQKSKNMKQHPIYIDKVCDYFMDKKSENNSENLLIFESEKDKDKIIDSLINGYCYVESLLYVKYMSLGLEEFILCLEKIKKSISAKQLFQVTKIEKIIQYYKKNFNININ